MQPCDGSPIPSPAPAITMTAFFWPKPDWPYRSAGRWAWSIATCPAIWHRDRRGRSGAGHSVPVARPTLLTYATDQPAYPYPRYSRRLAPPRSSQHPLDQPGRGVPTPRQDWRLVAALRLQSGSPRRSSDQTARGRGKHREGSSRSPRWPQLPLQYTAIRPQTKNKTLNNISISSVV
jgi:hypothetical protein